MTETETIATVESTESDSLMRVYEVGYHIVPSKKEDELDGVVAQIRALIEKTGGKLISEGAPALQRLAQNISVQEHGKRVDYDRSYFGWIKFEAPVEVTKTLEKSLATTGDVMRSVLFRTVREETRARFKAGSVREVRRGDVIRSAPRKEESAAPVSEEELEKAIEDLTAE